MGEIFRAYQYLNKALNLRLSDVEMYAAEQMMKLDFAEDWQLPRELASDPEELMAKWEFKATLVPRKDPISDEARKKMAEMFAEFQNKKH